jgi:hypothetical protein
MASIEGGGAYPPGDSPTSDSPTQSSAETPGRPSLWQSVKGVVGRTEKEFAFLKGLAVVTWSAR